MNSSKGGVRLSDIKLPHDTQAEVGVIGTLIEHPEFCVQISWFKPDYFYHKENKCIYWAIVELSKENIGNIDDFNIIKKINENLGVKGVFDELKIPSIQELLDNYRIVARQSLDEYRMLINRVINLAYKRRAYKTSMTFSELCLAENNLNLNDLNLKFHEEMNKLAEKFIINQDIVMVGELMPNVMKEIENQRQGGIIGIPSKYDFINEYFTYQNSELYVIGGRAKAGKSTFFLNEIHHKLKMGLSVCDMDTEMNLRRMLPRMLALESGLKIKEIESGTYIGDSVKEEKFAKAFAWWEKQKFVHMYDPAWNFEKIYATAKMLKIKKDFNLNFLVFDYIKDTGTKDSNGEKLNYFLGNFTNFLKNNIAGELDIPVLAGAQMSPYDTRLADSDSINRYASVVAYWMLKTKEELKKEESYNSGDYKFVIEYNRLGDKMEKDGHGINFQFDGDKCLIEQAEFQPLRNQKEFDALGESENEAEER